MEGDELYFHAHFNILFTHLFHTDLDFLNA